MMGSLTTVRGLGRISMCTSVSYKIGRLGFGGDSVTPNATVVYILHTTSFSSNKNKSMGIAGAYTGYSRAESVHAPLLLLPSRLSNYGCMIAISGIETE